MTELPRDMSRGIVKNNLNKTSLVVQMVKNPPANAGDTGSIPGPGRFHTPGGNEVHTS